jgi:PTS system nitrogen regulatory IIA component
MNMMDMLKSEYIICNLKSKNKEEVLTELSNVFHFEGEQIHSEDILRALVARENLGSTGIGEGIAIPHAKIHGLKNPMISFGRSISGIPFDSLDGKPAQLFFAILVPDHSTGLHLKLLASLSRMMKDTEFRSQLLKARSAEEIWGEIDHKNRNLNSQI